MIQNHVTSLELSKRLKELGVPQNSEFYWAERQYSIPNIKKKVHVTTHNNATLLDDDEWTIYSAFLSSELELPTGRYEIIIDESGRCSIWEKETGFSADSEADARAKMLIYLVESKRINVKDL